MSTSPGSQRPEQNATQPTASRDPWSTDSESDAEKLTGAPSGSAKKWIGLIVAITLNLAAFAILGVAAFKIFGSHDSDNQAQATPTQPAGGGGGGGRAGAMGIQLPEWRFRFMIIKDPAKRERELNVPPGEPKPTIFGSISEGLRNCPAGVTLEIRDQEVYEELIMHGRGSQRAGTVQIKIVAEKGPDGRTAVLRLPKDAPPGTALVQLDRAEGFGIRGLTLDGQGRSEDLIIMSGNCPGTTLEDLQLTGFQHSGVKLVNCFGKNEHDQPVPLRLRDLRIDAPAAGGDAGQSDLTGMILKNENQDVLIQRCRLFGPFAAAIRLDGSARGCEFEHNVIFGARRAVVFGRESAASQNGSGVTFSLTMSNNTFGKCDRALTFAQAPAAGSSVALNNNLFFHINQGLGAAIAPVTEEQLADAVHGECNARDPKSPLGLQKVPRLQVAEIPFELPTDRDKNSAWLRYPLKNPLAKAGQNGAFVGALTPLVKE